MQDYPAIFKVNLKNFIKNVLMISPELGNISFIMMSLDMVDDEILITYFSNAANCYFTTEINKNVIMSLIKELFSSFVMFSADQLCDIIEELDEDGDSYRMIDRFLRTFISISKKYLENKNESA